jgi:hypothetical protein
MEGPIRYQNAVDVRTPFPIGSRSIWRKHWRSSGLGRRANRRKPFCGSADDSETLPVEVQTTQQGGVFGLQYCVAVAEPSGGQSSIIAARKFAAGVACQLNRGASDTEGKAEI